MTFAEKFNSLKSAFEKANTKKFNADFAVQITMTDEDCGGTFYIEYKNGNYSVEPYDYYDNNAYVNASAASVAKLAKGTVAKDVEIGGDEEVVKTLAASLKPAKKPAAKKAPAKKTAVKKETKKATVKKEAPAKKVETKTVVKTAKPEAKVATKKAETPAKKTVVKKDTKTSK